MSKNFKICICGFVTLALVLAIALFNPTERKTDIGATIEEKNELMQQVYEKDVHSTQTEERKVDIPRKTKEEEQKNVSKEEKTEENVVSDSIVVEKTYCTLLVRCDLAIKAKDKLSVEKLSLLPPDGIIYSERKIEFTDGETAFDVLLREMQKNNIHMEFQNTPGVGAVYLEGIANLYEFDCGELSGWMYLINEKILSVSCSKYEIQNGDKIEFRYTCNMGNDLY